MYQDVSSHSKRDWIAGGQSSHSRSHFPWSCTATTLSHIRENSTRSQKSQGIELKNNKAVNPTLFRHDLERESSHFSLQQTQLEEEEEETAAIKLSLNK